MKILSFDLSLSSPGFAVIEIKKNKPRLIDCGHIKTKPSQSYQKRLSIIRNFLESIYLKYDDVDHVVRESVIYNRFNSRTNEVLTYVAGLLILTCNNHEIHRITPNKAKQLVTVSTKIIKNNEKREKERVEKAVRQWLDLPPTFEFGSNDESDACCVGIAFAIQQGILQKEG